MPVVSSRSGDGDDRCPGALRAHQAADGALVRIRLVGGQLTAGQLRRLAAAARRDADGSLELTSRGNLQLRGIGDAAGVARIADDVAEVGLLPSPTHERVRNLIASPLSGIDGRGKLDLRPLGARVDAAVRATPETARLSGRFLFALDDGRGDVTGLGADLCWVAGSGALLVAGRDVGLRIAVAAGVGNPRVAAGDVPAALVAAARAFLRAAAGRRDVWRVTDLPTAPAAIVAVLDGPHAPPVDPPRAAPPRIGPDPDGFVVAGAPLGRLTAGQAEVLAGFAADGRLVVTPWRTVVVPRPAASPDRLGDAGLIVDPASPWVGVTACTGRPGCASALADVRADATAAVSAAATAEPVPLHWAGCERRCGQPAGPAAVAVATAAGYRVAGPTGEHHGPLAHQLAQARRPR